MPPPAEQTQTPARDGRRERTEATRRQILESTRALILSGRLDPTASEIAAHAGITSRTLFRHFADMETLHREIILDAQAHAQAVMDEPFPHDLRGADSWQRLLESVIERRVRIYEYLLPLQVSSHYQRYRSSATGQGVRDSVRRRRRRLKEILPPEITADSLLFEALDATLSIEFWISLRQDQQLSVARARDVLQAAVMRIAQAPQRRAST